MSTLSKPELHTAFALSSVVGLRMFGLFLIMPVFTVHAMRLPGATPFLVGRAGAVSGASQALAAGRHCVIPVATPVPV